MSLPGSRPAKAPERALRSGHHGLPREVVAATQRDRIIDAFIQVVADRGYQRTTVVAVCKEAGVSSKTFYVHFTDKESCFLSAYDLGVEQLMGGLRERCRRNDPWPERLRLGLGRLLEDLAAAPAFARAGVVEVNAAGPAAIQRLTAVLSSCAGFFSDAPWDDSLPDVRESVVSAVVGGIYTRVYGYVVDGDTARLPELLPVLMYFSLLPFVGSTEAAKELAGGKVRKAPHRDQAQGDVVHP